MTPDPTPAARPTPHPGTVLQVPAPAELLVAPTPQDRALQVPAPAELVLAPTPQDRALAVAVPSPCGCPPTVVTLDGHRAGCPGAGTP